MPATTYHTKVVFGSPFCMVFNYIVKRLRLQYIMFVLAFHYVVFKTRLHKLAKKTPSIQNYDCKHILLPIVFASQLSNGVGEKNKLEKHDRNKYFEMEY
jgi:hypothetical protein